MKNLFPKKASVSLLAAALTFSVSTLKAGEEQTTVHHRHHHKTAAKTSYATSDSPTVKKVDTTQRGLIPTRDDRHSQEVEGGLTGGANGAENRVPTGSLLPERYDRRGSTTNGRENSTIIDQNDQRIQENNSVGDTLRSVPSLSVRGGR